MNKRKLLSLGVPDSCVNACIETIRDNRMRGILGKKQADKELPLIVAAPETYITHPIWCTVAQLICNDKNDVYVEREPAKMKVYGDIDEVTINQMNKAATLPMAHGLALCPDAHLGYGLSIGGVLALEDHVIPHAVGFDIGCRMHMTITDMKPEEMPKHFDTLCNALKKGTVFGTGSSQQQKVDHDILDSEDWQGNPVVRHLKDRAKTQLGTSGSGNHFVEFGIVTMHKYDLSFESGDQFVAILSHSGSRGSGHAVCDHYNNIAMRMLPRKYKDRFKDLAWLDMRTGEGQEYWHSMNLMGRYAQANHEVIHQQVLKLAGLKRLIHIQNFHNFAWLERHDGKDLYVHRKGATPAGKNELGIIPGSMGDPGFIVRGKGNSDSYNSSAHGAGRRMSRRKAKESFNWKQWNNELKKRGIHLIAGGIDEVPGAYKDIREVMSQQTDLVDVVAQFDPKIVIMNDDDSPSED